MLRDAEFIQEDHLRTKEPGPDPLPNANHHPKADDSQAGSKQHFDARERRVV